MAAATLLVAGTVAVSHFGETYAVSGNRYSDHFSHIGSTVLFAAKGLDVFRHPVRENLVHSTAEKDLAFAAANRLGTAELFVNPLDPARPPLAINWSFQIRPYPPGVYLLFAPVAALFQHELVSFPTANRLIITLFVLVAATLALVLAQRVFEGSGNPIPLALGSMIAVCWASAWALRGFYDIVPLLFVLLSIRDFEREEWTGAAAWGCAGVFLHYRALYYAPLVGIALVRLWRREGRRALGHPVLWVALSAAVVSGACFLIALPELEGFVQHSRFYHLHVGRWPEIVAILFAVATVALTAVRRDFVTAFLVVWFWLFLVSSPQAYPWHSMFMLPLLVFRAGWGAGRWQLARWATIASMAGWVAYSGYGV